MPTIREIQAAINEHRGQMKPIKVDGEIGRETTTAIAEFQDRSHLDIKYPGTIGPKTLEALGFGIGNGNTKLVSSNIGPAASVASPPWLLEAHRKLGLQEGRDNKTLREYLKSAGGTIGDPSKVPWCGDFVETVILKTLPHEKVPSNPYYALNWSTWGKAIDPGQPKLGAIMVFERRDRNGKLLGGHIAFLVGHDDSNWHVLGGNQSNAITITKIAKSRKHYMRWPETYPMPSGAPLPKSTLAGTVSRNEA